MKIAVIYHSLSGNVHLLAQAAATHAESLGHEVAVHRLPEIEEAERTAEVHKAALEDLVDADIVLWGTPGRYGSMSAPVKHFIDQTLPLHLRSGLANKFMTTFVSTATNHGGQESTVLAFNNIFYHWGAVIVPAGLTGPEQHTPLNGNPYGISSVSGREPDNVPEENLAAMRYLVDRLVSIAGGAR
ncbi:NAD(P)H dehydrogenase [Streptomyces sp. Ru71]|uniref:flavodoxin family protein n=1 Tax=Streptomyces sp. Ru71 TaxID=2080746 RepID=UPI000CDE53CC|nr:NAD(P)H-dependent oxidoreductase [Streptomyces sp. Ru71]POX56969.1 NAD(P)H dehydrogenase [Streptomyces sp. Ru71]